MPHAEGAGARGSARRRRPRGGPGSWSCRARASDAARFRPRIATTSTRFVTNLARSAGFARLTRTMGGMSTPSGRHLTAPLGAIAAMVACAATLVLPPSAGADGTVVTRLTKRASKSKLAAAGVTSTVGLVAGTGARLVRVKRRPGRRPPRGCGAPAVCSGPKPNFKLRALAGTRATAKDPPRRWFPTIPCGTTSMGSRRIEVLSLLVGGTGSPSFPSIGWRAGRDHRHRHRRRPRGSRRPRQRVRRRLAGSRSPTATAPTERATGRTSLARSARSPATAWAWRASRSARR